MSGREPAVTRLPRRTRLVSAAGAAMLTSLMRSTRYEIIAGQEHHDAWQGAGRPAVWALWHGRLLPVSFRHRGEGIGTLISHHKDGDYIAGVVERWGFHVVRGSSSRGGSAALRQLVQMLRAGRPIAVTPDGPRGPRQKMKLGPLRAAQLTGAPILPVTAGTPSAWWFEGWDRFLVPRPFARVRMAYGEPVFVERAATEQELAVLALDVEARLNRLTELVDAAA